MKKLVAFVLAILFVLTTSITTFAHSGRTDASGGHKDNKNVSGLGSYHYHCGGYPAHLHTNGLCPYASPATNSTGSSTKADNSSSTKAADASASEDKEEKYVVIVEKATIYEKASTKSESMGTAKEGRVITPVGSTKSFLKFEFKKKNDDTVYTGYIRKKDTQLQTE